MWRYIYGRILGAIPVLWIILTLIFLMLRYVPGGPFDSEQELPPEARQALAVYYDTTAPIGTQYVHYLSHILRADLGPSHSQSGWRVSELIGANCRVSLELGSYALLLAIGLGIFWGMMAAIYEGERFDRCTLAISVLIICTPTFVLGPLLNYIFAHRLHWFASFGWSSWRSKLLPVITLSLFYLAFIARLTRQSMILEKPKMYVRTAYSKGLSGTRVFWYHLFPNGIQTVIAYLGPACAGVLSGTFVVENVFNIPGLGRLFIQSIVNRDYAVITGITLLYSVLILLFNLLSDLLIAFINPQIEMK